jgi:ketopantoate reductase
MPFRAAVIGAGRLGSVVAQRLPEETEVIVFDIQADKGRQLAETAGGTYASELEGVRAADLIIIALPVSVVDKTVASLLGIVKKGAVILNMATSAKMDPALQAEHPEVTILDAKIIGQAKAIFEGEPGIVILDCANRETFVMVQQQLRHFCRVEAGDPELVETISYIASVEGIKAALAVRRQLRELRIPEEWIKVAISNCCAGTMKAFANDDIGPFSQKIVRDLALKD